MTSDSVSQRTNRSDTKYGDMLEDHEWDDPDAPTTEIEKTAVKNHEIDVILTTDPDEDMGYGREKYTVTISYDDETGDPYVLYVVEHRWKGNYWRDVTDWDWRDVPDPVRAQVTAVLPVDAPHKLDCGTRMMDEGGESRWEKIHKPRVDAMEGDEMWATSSLSDATRSLESAAEQLAGSEAGDRVEELVDDVRELHEELQADPEVDQ